MPTTLGARIASVRGHLKLSQAEFSRKIAVSRSYLSEVENEKGKPSIEMVVGIATRFPEVNLDWLLTGEGVLQLESGDGKKNVSKLEALSHLIHEGEERQLFGPSEDHDHPLNQVKWPLTPAQERLLEYFVPLAPVPGNIPFVNPFNKSADRQLQINIPIAITRSWADELFKCSPTDILLYHFVTNDFEPIIPKGSYALISLKDDNFSVSGYYLIGGCEYLEMWYVSRVSGETIIGTTKAPLDATSLRQVDMDSEELYFVGRVIWLAMVPHPLLGGADMKK